MTEPMVALMTTAEVAALQPFDAEPLAIVRRGTPHHLVFLRRCPAIVAQTLWTGWDGWLHEHPESWLRAAGSLS